MKKNCLLVSFAGIIPPHSHDREIGEVIDSFLFSGYCKGAKENDISTCTNSCIKQQNRGINGQKWSIKRIVETLIVRHLYSLAC